jgi:hypothetical protein
MAKWEYLYVIALFNNVIEVNEEKHKERVTVFLQRVGKEGWELASTNALPSANWRFIFKRQVI